MRGVGSGREVIVGRLEWKGGRREVGGRDGYCVY